MPTERRRYNSSQVTGHRSLISPFESPAVAAQPLRQRSTWNASFPGVFAFLFVMLKRGVQASDHFRCGFKQCLRLRVLHLFYVFAKMLDEFTKFPSDIRRMRPWIF